MIQTEPQIVRTSDGSDTLYIAGIDEHYHSVHGAIRESEHIFINCGLDYCSSDPVKIFEAGFGTGLNAVLTLIKSQGKRKVFYTSIDNYPLSETTISRLNYPDIIPGGYRDLFTQIHKCKWDIVTKITENFSLLKIREDLTKWLASGEYDLIYFDAFGPDKQPEMWSDNIFRKISHITVPGGIFVTYSSKGDVKRNLTGNGFSVTLLPGPLGKRHIIRAVKT